MSYRVEKTRIMDAVEIKISIEILRQSEILIIIII